MHIVVLNAPADQPAQRRVLTCPVCDSHRVVLSHLDCRALGPLRGEVRIGRDGLRVAPSIPDPEGGAIVGLRCTCDLGHEAVIRFRQLRGATYVERSVLPWTSHPSSSAAEN